jgi:hypothetical protein
MMRVTGSKHPGNLHYAVLGLVLVVGFWLRLVDLEQYPPGISADEAATVLDAFDLSQSGSYPLYEDFGRQEDNPRPEPLYQLLLGFTNTFFGSSIWAYRYVAVLTGLLTLATLYWAVRPLLRSIWPSISITWLHLAALIAVLALAVTISHITLSRTVYRAILQPPLMLLLVGFLFRAIPRNRLRDYLWSSVCLAAAMYTYTAALALPAVLALVSFYLLLRHRTLHALRPFSISIVFLALLLLPVGWRYLDRPSAVFGRVTDMQSSTVDWGERLRASVEVLFVQGDGNRQYNVDSVPVLPAFPFNILFVLGLLLLVWKWRSLPSWMLALLLVLSLLPALASTEPRHGLRIIGLFAVTPLIIAIGTAALLHFLPAHHRWLPVSITVLGLLILVSHSNLSHTTYFQFWDKPSAIQVFDRDFPRNEWFFRQDHRDLGQWLSRAQEPLLVPVDTLRISTVRVWLLQRYPIVLSAGSDVVLPADMRVVFPWEVGLDDVRRTDQQFALLEGSRIVLLPTFTPSTTTAIVAKISAAELIPRQGIVPYSAAVAPLANLAITYESFHGDTILFGGDAQLNGWRGPDTLSSSQSSTVAYTLEWEGRRPIGHNLGAFLQLQTQAGEFVAGEDTHILRWLYPSIRWSPGNLAYDVHRLPIPPGLTPGAYRLVAGLYVYVDERFPATTMDGFSLGDAPTIGYVKVPQPDIPTVPACALAVDATWDGLLTLQHAELRPEVNGLILRLYWRAQVNRPPVDATIFVHVQDATGTLLTQNDRRPMDGQYPTFIWDEGEIVLTEHPLAIPPDSDATIRVGLYAGADQQRLSLTQNGLPVDDGRASLGIVDALSSRCR